ncbi:MAG: FGGY family carbohydrate kinase [Pseudomonadota bacterium]
MTAPIVIGIDSSTTSTKALAFDAAGRLLSEGRSAIPMTNPQMGYFEQDPRDWWRSTVAALQGCLDGLDASAVKGLSISNQRETLGVFDADGVPVRPAILWLDERSRLDVKEFAETAGAERIHAITGRIPDTTSAAYRIHWVLKKEPDVAARAATFADVQSYLVHCLAGGPLRTGWPSADPLGLFDLEGKTWSVPLLDAMGLEETRLPAAYPPGTLLGTVTAEAAAETGLAPGTPVYAGGGDGQLAGLGTNCTIPTRAYINLGTAVVSGVWSPTYHYDKAWRTEIAGHGEGYILENCLRSGTFFLDWFVNQFVDTDDGADVYARLEAEAMNLPIGSQGAMVLPYLSGVMDPHWDTDARGVMIGLSSSHKQANVYRAILEGITLDQVSRTGATEKATGTAVDHFVAIGGGAASQLWRQMLADASGKEVRISATNEASALGAAMIAAAGAGLYGSIADAAAGMAGKTEAIEPNLAVASRYQDLKEIYGRLYAATADINQRLVAFQEQDAFAGGEEV